MEHSCWPSLSHFSPPSLDPVCSTLYSNCHNCLLARHLILHDFVWHMQCMVHDSQALGWFNSLFFEPVRTSPHPIIWPRKLGLLSSQSESWVDATCSLKIELVRREPSSSKPVYTGQIHDTACYTAHVRLYLALSCILGLNLCLRSLAPGIGTGDHQSLGVGPFEAQDLALHQTSETPLAEHHHV